MHYSFQMSIDLDHHLTKQVLLYSYSTELHEPVQTCVSKKVVSTAPHFVGEYFVT